MPFKYLRYFYLIILTLIFLYVDKPILFMIFFFISFSYIVWRKAIQKFEFLMLSKNINSQWLKYVDYDADMQTLKLIKLFNYLLLGCHFRPKRFGGNDILSYKDFLNTIRYKVLDKRNFKYIYKNININYNYGYKNRKKKIHNLKYNLKLLNKNTYNILNNISNLQKLNNKKKYYYIKRQWKE